VDVVVVYGLFGLTYDAIFALVRIPVTLFIIYLVVRTPFKRPYHWAFLAMNVSFLWLTSWAFLAQSTPNDASKALLYYDIGNFSPGSFQILTIFQFVVFFVSSRPHRWQKYVLIAGYAWVAATAWLPTLLGDESFIVTSPHLTAFGWSAGPGASAPYLDPYGIDIFGATMSILIFYLLIRFYRSSKLPLVRAQTKYVIVGVFFLLFGFYQYYAQVGANSGGYHLPTLQNLIQAPADFIAALALRKKGFYSVVPVAETAPPTPVVYPLEEARSYLAHDTKASFEAFMGLVRNGHEGLGITRMFPDQVRKDYGIQTTPIRWLAEAKGQDTIPPGDLLGLSLTVKDFYQKAKKPVVILQGVEYLTTINGFNPILRLIQGLSEENATKGGILILPVLPGSLNQQDEILLESETTGMPAPAKS